MRTAWVAGLGLLAAGCISTGFESAIVAPPPAMLAGDEPRAHVSVREERSEIEVVAGPFHVPAADMHADHHMHEDDAMKSPMIVVPWPVQGGLAGFRLAVYDSEGRELPRSLLHHVISVNFDRRQLVYPVAERLFGVGTETPDVKLPNFLEVPIEEGDSIGIYAMWNNTTGHEMDDVFLQVVIPYRSDGRVRQKALPIYMDTNNNIGAKTSFDLPPGHSEHSFEFELPVGGGLLAASGHLHDYGTELRLEDVATGKVITKLEPERDAQGRVLAVEQRIYRRLFKLIDARIRLEAGRRYRVVGVYDNPTADTIPDGGMAHIVGLFVPDDVDAWPALDTTTEAYRKDVAALPAPIGGGAHVHH